MTAAETRPSPGRLRKFISPVAMAGSLVFVAWVLLRDKDALSAIGDVGLGHLAAFVLVQIAYLVLQSYRQWIVLTRCGGEHVGAGAWLRIFLVGRLLNLVFSQAGNIYRGVQLKSAHGVNYTDYVTLFVAFAWLSNVLNLILAALVVGVIGSDTDLGVVGGPAALIILAIALAAAPFLIRLIVERVPGVGRRGEWLRGRALRMLTGSADLLRNRRFLAEFVVSGIFALALATALLFSITRALGVDARVGDIVVLFALLQPFTLLSITPGNLGIQESLFGAIFSAAGFGAGPGVVASAIVRVAGYVALIILAIVVGFGDVRRGLTQARRRRAEPVAPPE